MTDPTRSEEPRLQDRSHHNRSNFSVWIGPLVVFVGAVSYFLYFVRFPSLRDFPWISLPVIALGLVISTQGLRRAYFDATRGWLAKTFASVAFLFSLAVTALFCTYIFFLSYQLPVADGVVSVARAAPDFALPDQNGRIVRLSSFRGSKIVLDFYRGHW